MPFVFKFEFILHFSIVSSLKSFKYFPVTLYYAGKKKQAMTDCFTTLHSGILWHRQEILKSLVFVSSLFKIQIGRDFVFLFMV